ncbi:hypothetical protein QS306_00970 [Paraburkholderia bonniea]|uniref:hypothetical protein n=1 Tax=Paraburkholderia bonniea TaxID=2152891 RepID=UPI00257414AB|nr:hypothetical protein [Paraburkholderia bonniea]WJF90293.1 hypothetical protein QS306_00970 [Paraburkholderia bonniea]WJF93608.1 hypothetical protein QS308_00970 [Paraburkholderia bonniea]
MADADLKPPRTRSDHVTRLSVSLEHAPAAHRTSKPGNRPVVPWMQITDALLEQAGFLPGQQVMFSVDHRYGHITITPDHDYRIAGCYMTEPETTAMLERRSKRK